MNTRDCLPLVRRAHEHGDRTALIAPEGRLSYRQLLGASARVARVLLDGAEDLHESRVAFLVPPSLDYVTIQWGVWRAGGVAVPLAVSHPPPELEHVIRDSDPDVVVCHPDIRDRVTTIVDGLGTRLLTTDELEDGRERTLPAVDVSRRAMIVYTSGTTGKPKGVVSTHADLAAQTLSLVAAWKWSDRDHILNVLPLHHVHGIVNVLTCALWAGATCELMARFDPDVVWDCLARGDLTLFMAVPTVYHRLIAAWEAAPIQRRRRLSAHCHKLRLMVSGSAALPVATLERWREVTGHVLLERYGMTEFGMALSNPVHGARVPGSVGTPLPGVDVRLVNEAGETVAAGEPGEIQVCGPGVFTEYWRNATATRTAFRNGWFCTGDEAVVEDGRYRILGRSSVDIIKSGGFKISALEIEACLRQHPAVADCAVVGVKDTEWGQRVAAAVVVEASTQLDIESLRSWAHQRLAPYKVPKDVIAVTRLPRNAMGKVRKTEVTQLFGQ